MPNLITEPWRRYFADTATESNQVPTVTTVTVASRNTAIGTTPIPATTLAAGMYRVTIYVRIVTAAGVSSSATPSVIFTDSDAAVCTMTGTAVTGNTSTTVSSSAFLIRVKAGTPISYAMAYASNAAGVMVYQTELVLEQIG